LSKSKLLFVISLMFSIHFYGCDREGVKPTIGKAEIGEIPLQQSWQSTITFSDSGKTRAIVQAGRIRVFESRLETVLDSLVQIDFFDAEEIRTTKLNSHWGKVDDKSRDLYAYENVVVKNVDGVTLTTEKLMWRNIDRKITTDEFVTIVTPTEKIEGYGFESDQGLKNYTIFKITYITQASTLQ